MSEELKPCPFCGSDVQLVEELDALNVICNSKPCLESGLVVVIFKRDGTHQRGVDAWNTRATSNEESSDEI